MEGGRQCASVQAGSESRQEACTGTCAQPTIVVGVGRHHKDALGEDCRGGVGSKRKEIRRGMPRRRCSHNPTQPPASAAARTSKHTCQTGTSVPTFGAGHRQGHAVPLVCVLPPQLDGRWGRLTAAARLCPVPKRACAGAARIIILPVRPNLPLLTAAAASRRPRPAPGGSFGGSSRAAGNASASASAGGGGMPLVVC